MKLYRMLEFVQDRQKECIRHVADSPMKDGSAPDHVHYRHHTTHVTVRVC